jgi:predicted CopG family antitoxin
MVRHISITEEAYRRLKAAEKEHECFSDVIKRFVKKRKQTKRTK